INYEEFCRRCVKQGASQYHFNRLHDDPLIDEYCQVSKAKKCWDQVQRTMGMGFYRVREIESLLESPSAPGVVVALHEDLHRLYKWTFNAFKMKGIVDAEASSKGAAYEHSSDDRAPVVEPIV